ncbi:MAG TPA: hypothetical protein V6D05_13755 [Stenomitos sp.]
MEPDVNLKAGAKARLEAVRARIESLRQEMAAHEKALADLRAQLPELEFEEAAMRFIVEGAAAVRPRAPASGEPRRKLSRPELIDVIKRHLEATGRPVEVGDLHQYLEEAERIDLGANARNYLCGVLSRNKDVHFANVGKGEWWLAGRPTP